MFGWLDHRTGIRKFLGLMLLEGIPGGARWRYVWGSCLAFVFSIQLITGILLMTAYSPSASQAWNSVHTIQYKMDFGWLIRGLHHFGSQTMMVLIGLHMLQVVIAGAHLPPRELNWWTGIGLLSVTLGLSLTGYLLPWDQKGYWATDVATNIAGSLPGMGAEVKQQAVGGADSGNPTLTRFYALHVAVLPLSLILLLVIHLVLFRRHGVTCSENQEGVVTKPENEHKPGTEMFWPRQAFYDMLACMGVFAVMLGLVLYGFAHPVKPPEGSEPDAYESIARAGLQGKGAELDSAADRETANYPARPEWYFLFLFQLLKYFPGDYAIYGTVVIPNGVMLVLTLLPVFGWGPMRKFGHFFGILFVVTLLTLVSMLTLKALMDDTSTGLKIPYTAIPTAILFALAWIGPFRRMIGTLGNLIVIVLIVVCGGVTAFLFTKPKAEREPFCFTLKNSDKDLIKKAKNFEHGVEEAEYLAKRACEAAMPGTPVEGGHMMMRNDPYTRGRELFKVNCASCHSFTRQKIDDDMGRKWDPMDGVDYSKKKKDHEDKADEKKPDEKKADEKPIVKYASDLGNFGTKEWVRGLLKDPMDKHYFGWVKLPEVDDKGNVVRNKDGSIKYVVEKDEKGNTVKDKDGNPRYAAGLDGMRDWRLGIDKLRKDEMWEEGEIIQQDKMFDVIAEWLAEQGKPKLKRDPKIVFGEGQDAFFKSFKGAEKCSGCHTIEKAEKDGNKIVYKKLGGKTGPDLTNYGSAEWIRGMIMSPGHKTRYKVNYMPAFRNIDGPGSEVAMQEFRETTKMPDAMILPLSDLDRELIIGWMLREYQPIFGGAPINQPKLEK